MFRDVFVKEYLDKKARFMRCKNNHTSCEVCINVNMLLSDKSRKWPPAADNIIKHWRHLHLKQQWRERQDADEREERARTETDPATGQPLNFYMSADFVSNSVGDTPLFQKDGRHAKNERSKKHIQTRMCGVHVICGGNTISYSLHISLHVCQSTSLSYLYNPQYIYLSTYLSPYVYPSALVLWKRPSPGERLWGMAPLMLFSRAF